MGEESRQFNQITALSSSSDDENRVSEWEHGLPSPSELFPLSQPLVPPPLASAFRINSEQLRSAADVHRASQNTLSLLRRSAPSPAALSALKSFHPFSPAAPPADDYTDAALIGPYSPPKAPAEEAESSAAPFDNSDDNYARTLKRPRLVWTPQLHKRFVDVVGHIGIKNAVPKTIMQLMNVEGLTRENVASHLQKYRLYVKRMQGHSSEGPSSSTDHLFASTPVPQSLREPPQAGPQAVQMPYGVPTMIQMPVYGVQMGMVPGVYPGFGGNHPCGEGSKDWPGGN